MTADVPTPDWAALGAALRARREARDMSRADVTAAGGPSVATVQRIENGEIKSGIEYATRRSYESALELPTGWIDERIGKPRVLVDEQEPVVIEGDGERLLVAITEGVSNLSLAERRAVLSLVQGLQEGRER